MKSCVLSILALCLIYRSTATLIITTPLVTEFPNNSIPYYYANFGQVPYGKSLSYDIIVLDEGLCGNPPISKLKKPTYLVIPSNFHEICSYTKRAEVAQSLGAKGLIIASSNYEYAKGNVVEADDGNGKKVHITVLFISNDHYLSLKMLHKIQAIAKYEVPQDRQSHVTLFISTSQRSNFILLRAFKEEYQHLEKYMIVDVVYHTVNCSYCRSQDCLMTSYCSFDFDNYQVNVGSKIVKQQIHQYTIFKTFGINRWLQYMDLFDDYCDGDWNNIDDCTKNVIQNMGIKDASIIHPIDDTLRQWRVKETKIGFDNFPQVSINNMVYRGSTDVDDIFEAICASLLSPPPYCSIKYRDADEQESDSPKIGSVLYKIMMVFLIFLLIGIFLYKKVVKSELTRDMASRVGQSIANYAAKISATGSKRKERNTQLHEEAL